MSKINPKVILIESVAIFLSVFLAFAAEQWRDDINERQRANDILLLVLAELKENLKELESVAPKRQTLLEQYLAAMRSLVDTGKYPTTFPDFIVADTTDVAYQLATDSEIISRVEPEKLLAIAGAYEAINEVEENRTFLSNRNAQIRYDDAEQYLSGFIFFTNNAIMMEPAAIESIKLAIDLLEK